MLNITPDSFSDGGENLNLEENCAKAEIMIKNGADFIDIGGESTRPGASKVKPNDEILRVLPTIQSLSQKNINLSLDTRNSSTMELGILAGVKIINDVSALKNDKKSIDILTKYKTPVILMHMPGTPKTMMKKTNYFDVVLDVYDFLEERIRFCELKGIKRRNIIIDPGIGFGKNFEQNIKLLKHLSIFHTLECPIMLGISRKRFISLVNKDSEPKDRLGGTISTTIHAMMQGINIHRVHDVKEVKQAIDTFEKLNEK
ncbi:MAG: dihydropteroate synthase [Rickettsiales bacterium]|nr:dihydropteroate synthase [Rickettsiales bacterium]